MTPPETILLSDIAHGRSGDKGNHANVAVIAYTTEGYAWIRQHLTAEVVAGYFQSLGPSRVVRYEAANLLAVNFLLYDVLAGGASRSLRSDTQGKTLALALLRMPLAGVGKQCGPASNSVGALRAPHSCPAPARGTYPCRQMAMRRSGPVRASPSRRGADDQSARPSQCPEPGVDPGAD